MFTLVTGDLGIVGRWRAVCVTALQPPNSDAAAIDIVVGIAAASLSVTGIISRVTDTVKSIVPAWLQKYFNKDDEVPGRSSNLIRAEDHTDTQNEEQSHTYVQEDLPATADDRITLEHVRTQEDHSTSRLALSLPEVLTRPSLHRANLNFNLLDSPALNCQPSTSSAYPIVTSNFSLVKEIKDSTSQHDDDNISTTSGFSSRASDKDIAVTKNLNAPPLWSPEADRSHFSHNSSMTSRKPTFNLSTFGSLSPSLGNSSVLKSSQLGDSPFYPGKTTYGGAASVRTSRVRSTPYQAPIRRQVKPKPTNNQSYGVTSSTARRILQSLEKMSSPLADARRIPSISSPSAMGRAKYACAGAMAEDQKRTSWKEDRRRRSGPETPIRPDQQRDRPWIPENVTDTADNSSKRKKDTSGAYLQHYRML
ncbi:unnamed protein product [Ranitomeya imitator]|uniref:Nucleoporin Nup153 N-terminal domain-containing protein n=1 Tax=Ranitomeya imitator TaxID=111125 RepID=A0ABN9LTV2_9NEOB|nr:unnamed protein product [Ranitomeya imitator]